MSAEDYPDFEAALQAASSRFGATHVVRQGNRSAIIYSPTSKGYERRSLSCDRGFFHWPKQADLVDEVPENAERVVDVLDLGFDPDAPPRREAVPVRRAAEEAGKGAALWKYLTEEQREYVRRGFDTNDPPILLNNVAVGDFAYADSSLDKARTDIQRRAPSRTKAPVSVWHDPDKDVFFLIDGHHRLAEAMMRKDKTIAVTIVGSGYSDYYATPSANEARGSDRERWEKLQSEFRRLTDEMTKVEVEAHVKWGPHGLRYASRALQTKHQRLKGSRDRVYEKIFAMTQKLSPRDWGTGVPTWWVAGKLTFDDLVRPIGEPLSVTPPLAYGATRPMQEGAREMGAVREEVWRGRRSRYESSPAAQREREVEKNKAALAEFLRNYDVELLRKRDPRDVEWIYIRPEGELESVRSFHVGSHPYHGEIYESIVKAADGTLYLQQPGAMGFVYSKLIPKSGTMGAQEMGHVREVREGRHYESAQWLEFECEPATPTPELEEMAREFKKLLLEFLASYARTWSIDISGLDEDSFAWNAYASIVGHGVGLWEGDGDTGLRGDDEKKIDKALRGRWHAGGSLVGRIHNVAHQISNECAMLSEGAGGREAREEASIPTKAQLKIIQAFRDRRLMGNPMRDSISTDGDTIYSYRMPIAGRNPRGGIWIADPGGAPSVTTRNHIYGLQRTFTPTEIAGTRAAERDDDSPDTERAPAPEAAPRMQPGYAFYTPSRRKGDWKKIPNDDWEHVIVGEDEIEKADLVGMRLIDGSMHDIFEIAFAPGRGGRGYYAQLQTHTRGRSAAHEGAVLLDHMANDFVSPKEAIVHAQSSWGATHVDFHGTRNSPTVYGTKDGARWKKTLYKEKGKFHWPDKFAKGPKRLHGAIELTPVDAPTHAPASVQHRAPPMQRPPTSPMPDRREGYVSEARRETKDLIDFIWRRNQKYQMRADAEGHWINLGHGTNQWELLETWPREKLLRFTRGEWNWPVRDARENPATDLQDAIPWVRVTRDPERYKEALARAKAIGPIDDAKKVYELVGPALLKEDQETFIVVLIDVRQNCRGVAEIHRGARSRVATSVLDVMRIVVASGAEGFIVCHNHPSGKAMPSDADRDLTKAIERAAKPFKGETAFLDHVVCGAGEYFSFADNKLHRAKS